MFKHYATEPIKVCSVIHLTSDRKFVGIHVFHSQTEAEQWVFEQVNEGIYEINKPCILHGEKPYRDVPMCAKCGQGLYDIKGVCIICNYPTKSPGPLEKAREMLESCDLIGTTQGRVEVLTKALSIVLDWAESHNDV